MLRLGIDIGSTTIKALVIDKEDNIIFKEYFRHKSSITDSLTNLIESIKDKFPKERFLVNFTGSASMLLAKRLEMQFTQEVISATTALKKTAGTFDCCIELGGEDAKIIYLGNDNLEQRMNGTCAGGTGAFIDQMATLLHVSTSELNELAKNYHKIYPIASRCGVFAKSDIQPLLNQGASHEDIAVSIYQAIVNQTITGLSQGRKIQGRVAFLGGPLTFSSELRRRFIETLGLTDVFIPENGEVFVAFGAALEATGEPITLETMMDSVLDLIAKSKGKAKKLLPALFKNKTELNEFIKRHDTAHVDHVDISKYSGKAYLGIDAGSTTTKLVLISENNDILHSFYSHNQGTPVDVVKKALYGLYEAINTNITICGALSTGYGEELIKNAFNLDSSEVETICHSKAAAYFNPAVDFIIDIGGQDMKCIKLENGLISSIILNEACSSGCGSFLETFAQSLGYEIGEFAELSLKSRHPVDLGSRCTVFMNSGVKQAQADGALTEDISAGLAYSVIKNALYKVIRTVDAKRDLGENILVQGGTFYNNSVLRAFEREIGMEVTRPNIAGLMGAFGAALLAKNLNKESTSMTSRDELDRFVYTKKNAICNKCSNLCQLTINIFNDKKYISGNRCEQGAGIKFLKTDIPNLYLYKYDKILSYQSDKEKTYKYRVGIPLILNMYENIPFWFTFFDQLGCEVVYSDRSSRSMYELGQDSISSDTVCYPAKLVHGHIENIMSKNIDILFYPNMPYNFKEKHYRDNEYNCPVVAFYPEVVRANIDNLDKNIFYDSYLTLNSKRHFVKTIISSLDKYMKLTKKNIENAFDQAYQAYMDFRKDVIQEGERALQYAKDNHKRILLLAGRPYHIDPEIHHGLPKLLRSLDVVVLSEDAVNTKANQKLVKVLNQWTYHTRLYDSAKYISKIPNANLVQLVSFGCGLDAITADEVKSILESHGKVYTQIKIDEVNNLGTANIRIRSLLSTMRGDD